MRSPALLKRIIDFINSFLMISLEFIWCNKIKIIKAIKISKLVYHWINNSLKTILKNNNSHN